MKIKGRLEVDWIVDFLRTGAAVVNSKGKNILFIYIYIIFFIGLHFFSRFQKRLFIIFIRVRVRRDRRVTTHNRTLGLRIIVNSINTCFKLLCVL